MFSLSFAVHDLSISCNFHGNRTVLPPREGFAVGRRSGLETIVIFGLDGGVVLTVLLGDKNGFANDFNACYERKVKKSLHLSFSHHVNFCVGLSKRQVVKTYVSTRLVVVVF